MFCKELFLYIVAVLARIDKPDRVATNTLKRSLKCAQCTRRPRGLVPFASTSSKLLFVYLYPPLFLTFGRRGDFVLGKVCKHIALTDLLTRRPTVFFYSTLVRMVGCVGLRVTQ